MLTTWRIVCCKWEVHKEYTAWQERLPSCCEKFGTQLLLKWHKCIWKESRIYQMRLIFVTPRQLFRDGIPAGCYYRKSERARHQRFAFVLLKESNNFSLFCLFLMPCLFTPSKFPRPYFQPEVAVLICVGWRKSDGEITPEPKYTRFCFFQQARVSMNRRRPVMCYLFH